ncbi:MAG TPA: polyphosphate kinase 2 family protein [Planctomycetota bacterium]|nr:polyphosphate kinase 2 family protein [Planctomycetota bacterium]
MSKQYRIDDGSSFRIKDVNPDDTGEFKRREEAEEATRADLERLAELQERFYIDNRKSLLVVLQAMDTGGKDGTIKHVFSGLNPVGCQVTSFKKPTHEEMDHDFLWRINRALPPRGTIGIFNRSHYEDVLIVRVHDLVPKAIWSRRYEHINTFEKLLTDENTIILKFFLHISKDEQKKRLEARLKDREKTWKFDPNDLKERQHWDDYQDAFENVIRRCSTPHAPWYVVPANKKWFRNYVVANAITRTLSKLDLKVPKPDFDPAKIKVV